MTAGTNSPTVSGNTVSITGGITASGGSAVVRSPSGGHTTIKSNTKAGGNKANASNHGGSKTGGIRIHF